MFRFLGRSVGVMWLLSGIALTFAIAMALILIQLFGEERLIEEVECRLGLSADCLRQQLEEERVRVAEMQGQVGGMQQRVSHLEAALSGRMVFDEGPSVAGLTIVVGTIYQDNAARSEVIRAICWATMDRGGLDPRVPLAEMDADGVISLPSADSLANASIRMDAEDVPAARDACPWPVAVQ